MGICLPISLLVVKFEQLPLVVTFKTDINNIKVKLNWAYELLAIHKTEILKTNHCYTITTFLFP